MLEIEKRPSRALVKLMTAVQRHRVRVLGEGSRTLMFAHGYGCDQNMWRAVVPAFLDDFRIVLFDNAGAGSADVAGFDKTRHSSLHGYALDVLDIITELGLTEVNFVGHSVSAMIGMLASIARPGVFKSLVMIGPSPSYINDGSYIGGFERSEIDDLLELLRSNHLGWSITMAPVIMGNPDCPSLAKELEESFCRTNPASAHHFARVIFLSDHRADLPQVTVPTLILQTREDPVAPVEVGEYVQRAVPNSQLIVMHATGHCPHLSSPEEVVLEVRRFLQSQNH